MTTAQIAELGLKFASSLALAGWAVLVALPGWTFGRRVLTRVLIPAVLALAYIALFPPLAFDAPGGYGSIADITTLLTSDPRIILAAWIHYLVFDMLVGNWIVTDARRRGIRHWTIVPALVLTFLFGPFGWLVYRAQRWWRDSRAARAIEP
jgi:Domain of unknown function (DUF4281)